MIGRVVLAALLAGIAAGIVMGAIQHVRLTPLILEAETFEGAEPAAAHDHAAPATAESQTAAGGTATEVARQETDDHHHDAEAWAPEDGWQRTLSTTVSSAITGAAFAALMAGVSLVSGIPLNRRNGAVWGLCGFLAVIVAPAAGLAPELPGMPAGDLVARQVWWVGTIVATGVAIYLIATRRETWALAVAVLLIGLPHIIGAPMPATHESAVPPNLSASFAANVIAANAVFFVVLGTLLGLVLNRYVKELDTA